MIHQLKTSIHFFIKNLIEPYEMKKKKFGKFSTLFKSGP